MGFAGPELTRRIQDHSGSMLCRGKLVPDPGVPWRNVARETSGPRTWTYGTWCQNTRTASLSAARARDVDGRSKGTASFKRSTPVPRRGLSSSITPALVWTQLSTKFRPAIRIGFGICSCGRRGDSPSLRVNTRGGSYPQRTDAAQENKDNDGRRSLRASFHG